MAKSKKKGLGIAIIILFLLFLLSLVFYRIDYTLLLTGKRPLFSLVSNTADQSGSQVYYGLGYQIICWEEWDPVSDMFKVGTEKHYLFGFSDTGKKADDSITKLKLSNDEVKTKTFQEDDLFSGLKIYADEAGNLYYMNGGSLRGYEKQNKITTTDNLLSEEEIRQISDRFLSYYLGIQKYRNVSVIYDKSTELYRITYGNTMQGIEISDRVEIILSKSGEILSFYAPNYNKFVGVEFPLLNKKQYQEKLEGILAKEHPNLKGQYQIISEILDIKKNQLVITYTVSYFQDGKPQKDSYDISIS